MKSNKTILEVSNLSKQYKLGLIGTGSIKDDLKRWWYNIRGKEDPFLTIGDTNNRSTKSNSDYVWALQDINFKVLEGEVLGIIGKNGAGKSTLLKILSRVTTPTTGAIKTKGRIASLLEVGTGFHPELTGRENIYLNGAILGMTKKEIQSKEEEIVAFSGCERYIDTPVKRYSSGMGVRLAFAVAAHLEPDILVIDEVLAVGDAEFQKKAIGKMQDISKGQGRTVLFVSHNMAAVKSLCTRAIVLEHGKNVFEGGTDECVDFYLQSNQFSGFKGNYQRKIENGSGIEHLILLDKNNANRTEFGFDEPVTIRVKINIEEKYLNAYLGFRVIDKGERIVFTSEIEISSFVNTKGLHEFEVSIPTKLLVPNIYHLNFAIHVRNVIILDLIEDCLSFQIVETGSEFHMYKGKDFGCVFIDCSWKSLEFE